jgi:hypothetical protein
MAVYFARKGQNGPIKIGCSAHVEGRLRRLGLTLVAEVVGMYKTEKYIHAKFDHLRISGEWFRAEPELFDFIASPELEKFEEQEREPKTTQLVVRISPKLRAQCAKTAARDGLLIGQWIRMILLEEIRKPTEDDNERKGT